MNTPNTEKSTFTTLTPNNEDLLKYLLKEGSKTKEEFLTEISERFLCREDFEAYLAKP